MKHQHRFTSIEKGGHDSSCCGCCYCSQSTKRCTWCVITTPLAFLVLFFIALVIRTALITEGPFVLQKLDHHPNFLNLSRNEIKEMSERLGNAIKIPTISYNQSSLSTAELGKFHRYLRDTFPKVFDTPWIEVNVINQFSLLFWVQGQKTTQNPYLLCAHMDVVPEGDFSAWSREPFSGEIFEENGEKYIFGRGAIDDKQAVLAIMETLDRLIKNGNQPKRSFYVAFGHDEEVSGNQGAGKISKELSNMVNDKYEKIGFILDEGMFVMDGVFPGVDQPVAYVGVVEKGWANVELSVQGVQGHSSTPPKESAVGILAHAMAKLEDTRQPSRFGHSVEYDTMSHVAPYASFGYKLVLGNLWLFKDIVAKILSNDAKTDAIQRTTSAITVVNAGIKSNVIPNEASALVNHRIHPADSVQDVIDNDNKIIDDSRVKVNLLSGSFPASKVSPYDSESMSFQIIVNSANEIFPNAHITPGVMVANTDTKHYQLLCDNIYRFQPVLLHKSDISRFHGIDERISVRNYIQVVEFYHRLVTNADFDTVEMSAAIEISPNNDDLVEIFNDENSEDFGMMLEDYNDALNDTTAQLNNNNSHDEN